MRRLFLISVALMAFAGVASGYYHFLRFPTRAGGVAIPEKFDVSTLPNKTLRFYVAETGPTRLNTDDTFAAVVSQIKLAAKVWNDVDTSDIRLQFGGLINPDTPQSAAGIDVVFDDDLPPGVIAQGGLITVDASSVGANSTFVPALRSKVRLRRDLTRVPLQGGASLNLDTFDESFFLTLVHEFGHALGLQHTLTSSVMSTSVTRGTTKAKPLTADDVAGISLLYPARSFSEKAGSLRGRVTIGGTGVNMASVVVISPNGPAISALTNPDGTYEIQGVPKGSYYAYVHPLPPANSVDQYPADILPPLDSYNGTNRIATRQLFTTQFYSSTISVDAGTRLENINFTVQQRASLPLWGVQTYGFIGQVSVKPPPVNSTLASGTIYAAGTGLTTADGTPSAGLGIEVLGGGRAVPGSLRRYAPAYMAFDVPPPFGDGPRHLVFDLGGDRYVLPNAFNLVQRAAPAIGAVSASTEDGLRVATINGSNLAPETQVIFDGADARVLRQNGDGSLVTLLPSAPNGHKARVVALNTDGQSSIHSQGRNVYQFAYDGTDNAGFSLNVSSLPAGAESLVEVNGASTAFTDGEMILGFGSSDIQVRRLWVTGPNKALANVFVQPQAATGNAPVSLANGVQLLTAPVAMQVTPANPRVPVFAPQSLVNRATNLNGVWPGAAASIDVANLNATNAGTLNLTINDQRVAVSSVSGNTIFFQVPATLAQGPAILKIQNGTAEASFPIALQVDATPPVIRSALAGGSTVLDQSRWVKPTDLVGIVTANLYDATGRGAVKVNVGGVDHDPVAVLANGDGTYQVQIVISSQVTPGNQVPVTVNVGTRISQPITLVVRAN